MYFGTTLSYSSQNIWEQVRSNAYVANCLSVAARQTACLCLCRNQRLLTYYLLVYYMSLSLLGTNTIRGHRR